MAQTPSLWIMGAACHAQGRRRRESNSSEPRAQQSATPRSANDANARDRHAGLRSTADRMPTAYPQDDDPLCCCEYRNRHGERAHVCGCCCMCDEIDQAADGLVSGRGVGRDQIDEILKEIDDRIRVPVPFVGGAWHVGVPGGVPWVLLPLLLLVGAISARCLLFVACAMLPSIYWWHRRGLRLRRRSPFLMSWMLASLAYETALYARVMPDAQSEAATLAFAAPLLATLLLFGAIKRVDAASTAGVADVGGAMRRAHRCAVCAVLVPRYDHYCSWVDEPIGAANHRAFLAFVLSMVLACSIGACQMLQHMAAPAAALHREGSPSAGGGVADLAPAPWSVRWWGWWWWRTLVEANASSPLLSFTAYALAVSLAVGALLVHQLSLVAAGTTTHGARRRARAPTAGSSSSGIRYAPADDVAASAEPGTAAVGTSSSSGSSSGDGGGAAAELEERTTMTLAAACREFLEQTAPLGTTLLAAAATPWPPAGAPPEARARGGGALKPAAESD